MRTKYRKSSSGSGKSSKGWIELEEKGLSRCMPDTKFDRWRGGNEGGLESEAGLSSCWAEAVGKQGK
jgi:hypothetical protein